MVTATCMRRPLLLLAAVALALGLLGNAEPASAASGGGCKGWQTFNAYFSANACISAVAYATALPDGYVRLASTHPTCTIAVKGVRVGDRRIMSTRYYTCPSGYWQGRVPGYAFKAYSGTYVSAIYLVHDPSRVAYSPYLYLP